MNLSKKLNVTSVVVTHEMDSVFRIADRMVMLDMGQVLIDGTKAEFEKIRDNDATGDETNDLVRQFLRGDSEGPLTKRRQNSGFKEEILNIGAK